MSEVQENYWLPSAPGLVPLEEMMERMKMEGSLTNEERKELEAMGDKTRRDKNNYRYRHPLENRYEPRAE